MKCKTKASRKTASVIREFKAGKLHSGRNGKTVTSRKQAVAIALSQGRKASRRRK
jgi:hypothetical protein